MQLHRRSIKLIIKIFKVSTKEMFTFKSKAELMVFVFDTVGKLPAKTTIDNLIKMLPKNDYCKAN